MKDLIERQVAIDAIDNLPNCYNGYSDTYDKSYIIGVLEELLPAEPEIIRCRDCKHSYDDIGGSFCSFGVCVDCVVDPAFYCANAERRQDGRFNQQTGGDRCAEPDMQQRV